MQPDLRTEHQKRTSEAMKRWWAKRRAEGWAKNRRYCKGCGIYSVEPDESLCPGCDAYREHQQ